MCYIILAQKPLTFEWTHRKMVGMRDWKLSIGDPLVLTLASDARLSNPDYINDHIWEVDLNGGEPSAVSVHTTFGLRALAMRLFPRFIQGSTVLSDPITFIQPPVVRRFFPNYLLLSYSPFSGLDVASEYWVPDSHALAGRFILTNTSVIPIEFRFEWVAILQPLGEGEGMTPAQIDLVNLLQGRSGGLAPVLIMTGSPTAETIPFPSLTTQLELMPGNSQQLTWFFASLAEARSSFEHTRQLATCNWEASITHLELHNEYYAIDIETGNPAWDAAFAFSQKTAFNLFFPSNSNLPDPSFVLSRYPDQGYSRRGDGTDYDHTWNGQTALEAYYLTGLLLPGAAHLAKGLVKNFLATQTEDGFVDFKPGLNGRRGQMSATPLLAGLSWRIFQTNQDPSFLTEVFPSLLKYLDNWFNQAHDRDQDGYPEWDHPIQTGFEENPVFDHWHAWGQGFDITTFENPGLAAMLYKELHNLGQIARQIKQPDEIIQGLSRRAEILRQLVESVWDSRRSLYRDRDRDTHLSPPGEALGRQSGPGEMLIQKQFKNPQRLQITIYLHGDATRPAHMTVFGQTSTGDHIEEISARSLVWVQGKAGFTTQDTYLTLERIDVQGLDEQDEVILTTVGYAQTSLLHFLPLWAGIPGSRRAAALIRKGLLSTHQFLLPYGLPLCPISSDDNPPSPCDTISLPWNQLMVEGLLAYGYRTEAAHLFQSWMSAIIPTLQSKHAFYSQYQARSGEPIGVRHALSGLAPLGLFLDILGVRILTPTRLMVNANNPFPWSVRIHFRGLSILREAHHAHITFPNGQTASVNGPSAQLVSLD
jgi:hypothetical protein